MAWRRIDVKMWRDAFFKRLGDDAKILWVYMLTSPQSSGCGIYVFSRDIAAIDLHWKPSRLREVFEELVNIGKEYDSIRWDEDNLVILLPKFLNYNPPARNSIKSWSFSLESLPEDSPLLAEWYQLTEQLMQRFAQPLQEQFKLQFPQQKEQEKGQQLSTITRTLTKTKTRTSNHLLLLPQRETKESTESTQAHDEQINSYASSIDSNGTEYPESTQSEEEEEEELFFIYDKNEWNREPTNQEIKDWREAFPGVHLRKELDRATLWLKKEKKKKNRVSDFSAFLNKWFSEAQDRIDEDTNGS